MFASNSGFRGRAIEWCHSNFTTTDPAWLRLVGGLRGRAIECQTNSTTTAPVAMATKYKAKLPITRRVYKISPRSLRLREDFGIKLSNDVSFILNGAILVHNNKIWDKQSAITHFVHCESKNWATFLRPITLEILNRSSPHLAQIKVSSFWTSCQSLFKSTLENRGAI